MTAKQPRETFENAVWHTSSYSDNGSGCVERGRLVGGRQAVRDTKDRAGAGVLVFGPRHWQSFVDAVRTGGLGA